jgi:hypothetical protein
MTDLHYALLGAAALVLVLVFGWSKWNERRQIRRLSEAPGSSQKQSAPPAAAADAAAGAGRIEPRLGELPGVADTKPDGAGDAAPHARPQLSGWTEDPMLDCVLEVRCAHAADGVAVIDAMAPVLRLDCGLPTHVVAWDARAEQWVLPDRFGFYGEMLASIQLANRRATLGDIEASRFIAAVQQMALALDADFDPPDVPLLRRRAEQLQAQIAPFDVQIGLTLQPADGLFNPALVQKAVAAVRLEPDGDSRWLRRGEDGWPQFAAQLTKEHRLLLELDVPLAAPAARPLQTLFAAAAELAVLLNARVVDDHQRPIAPGSIEAIEPALQGLYAKMRAAEIEPGSERARRLFA